MSKKKIKICETIRQGKIGGGESHVYQLVNALNRDEFEPVVLSFSGGELVENLKEAGIKTYVVDTQYPFDPRVKAKVKKIFDEEKFDVLHAHGTRSLSNTLSNARKFNLPVLYTVHGWSFHQDQPLYIKKARVLSEKYLTSNADCTICVSDANRDEGISRFGLNNHKRINYAIDVNKFNPHKKYPDLKKELGVPAGNTVAGFIVRMTKQKDPLTVIKAASIIAKKTDKVTVLVIGDGELKNDAMALASKLNLSNTVKFHPFRQDIPAVLANTDIYMLPSLWEGLPIGILEAMAMKKAIVATPADGSKEVIINNDTGLLVPFNDPQKLAEAVLYMHDNKVEMNRMAENAYYKVVNEFSLDNMMNKIENLYRSCSVN